MREIDAMDFNQVMTIYLNTVDQTATVTESSDLWHEVQAEIEAVITAPTKTAAGQSSPGGSLSTSGRSLATRQ